MNKVFGILLAICLMTIFAIGSSAFGIANLPTSEYKSELPKKPRVEKTCGPAHYYTRRCPITSHYKNKGKAQCYLPMLWSKKLRNPVQSMPQQ